jgi:uncharacterized protein
VRFQLVVIAKDPVPGRVKTRLCPPCTPEQAAEIARASIEDTMDAASLTIAARHVLLLSGGYPQRPGWTTVPQRGNGLAERLRHGFKDTAHAGAATLLIGMDTPQVTAPMLESVARRLSDADAVLCPAVDGGWWALALRDPAAGAVLASVPMSHPDTCSLTRQALAGNGLRVSSGPILRDVDTMRDALEVASSCPATRFAAAVASVGAAVAS